MSKHFPLPFFRSLISVNQMFDQRNRYRWWQLGFILLFVQSLLLIPLTLQMTQRGTELATALFPDDFELTDVQTQTALGDFTFVENQLIFDNSEIISETNQMIVGTQLSETEIGSRMGLNFTAADLEVILLKNEQPYVIRLYYTDTLIDSLKNGVGIEEIQSEIGRQNGGVLVLANVFNLGLILFAMNSMLLLGVAGLFYMTKKASNIHTFKESFTIALSLLAGGTILATVVALGTQDVFVLFGVQSLWMVAMSIRMYVKTRFNRAKVAVTSTC